ncbi:aldo/keto reductase [Enterococcus saccharolyticus]|uniref:aldo/keto reductase family protein n=1 Tax=Enterococcus saccharolyticus TaxID=41997 RepID=UPI001E57AA4F|nr:aldo/keto reductase [Enterococcus saccharolyticus]MCD5003487.1 aldo/keto reductase [Enterococcus saccharolyticus]
MEYVELNTGINIPIVGSGTNTFGKVNHDYMGEINGDTTELLDAISLGYRHFDTAIAYRNEAVVGRAIKESGLDRSEFFITSKIPGTEAYYKGEQDVQNGVEASLKALDTDYIDLYLIHHPWNDLEGILQVWKVLEEYVDKGVLKAIGVSNFEEKELTYLTDHARIQPAVNQIESHPGNWNADIIEKSFKLNVIPEAWGPLTRVSDEAKAVLDEIGASYNKTWAQVILRYQVEQGIIVIPKSHNKERQAQNKDLFDFELTKAERERIAVL